MMGGCAKCHRACGWIVFILGVLFLLRDFGIWDFWGVSWWTALFLVCGFGGIAQAGCKDCQAIMSRKR